MDEILFALWFYLPAGAANMAPVFAKHLKFLDGLDIPLDLGKSFRKQRIFGNHKTVRGVVSGFVLAVITLLLQTWFYNHSTFIHDISLVDYNNLNILGISALFTLGALGGDAIESFFKRQAKIKPGTSWAPFDQADWIIGAVLVSLFFTSFTFSFYLWAIAWGLLLHPISTTIGWVFKLKDDPI